MLLEVGWLSNPQALMGAFAMLVVQLAFTYSPWMNRIFQTQPLGIDSWLRIFAVAGISMGIVELEKWIRFTWRGKRPAWQND
jgi:Ca2+-transporting ATPase